MLMEELFARGIMTIGPSRADPVRQVGVFNPAFVATLPALRASEMEKFRWLAGEWTHENRVPATRLSPAHTDIGSSRFGFSESDGWIYALAPNGDRTPQIMTMVGITRNWRMTWTRQDDDEFRFVNEEQAEDGAWVYIDDYPHDWRDLPEATETHRTAR